MHRDKGVSNDEFFTKEFDMATRGQAIVASATIKRTYYAAIRNADGETWALVCLLQWVPRDYFNFGYKDIDETMGPNESEAPARVLDALTSTTSEWANEWRTRCRENLARKQATPTVKTGDVLRFAHSFKFTDGSEHSTFTFVTRNTFKVYGRNYRLPANWKGFAFEVTGHDDAVQKPRSNRVTHSLVSPERDRIAFVYGKADIESKQVQYPGYELRRGKVTFDQLRREQVSA